MNIIEKLDTQRARNRSSDRAVARACGVTVKEMDADTRQPDPKAEEVSGDQEAR